MNEITTNRRLHQIMEPNYDNEQNAPPHRQRPSTTADQQQPQHHHASNADLLDSAKYLAGAARSAFNRDSSNKVDTGHAAGAAADLLDAASHYTHFEEKSFGKYVDQAEDYLHKYQSSHSTTTAGAGHVPTSSSAVPHNSSSSGHVPPRKDEEDDSGNGGGGYGDYIKMAQGFLKK